jgi:hypothetical protein
MCSILATVLTVVESSCLRQCQIARRKFLRAQKKSSRDNEEETENLKIPGTKAENLSPEI